MAAQLGTKFKRVKKPVHIIGALSHAASLVH